MEKQITENLKYYKHTHKYSTALYCDHVLHDDHRLRLRPLREAVSVMWCRIVDIRTMRNNSKWINRWMAPIVVLLNVLHLDRATNSGDLENVFRVTEDVGILT